MNCASCDVREFTPVITHTDTRLSRQVKLAAKQLGCVHLYIVKVGDGRL